jgi:hypothetical protein
MRRTIIAVTVAFVLGGLSQRAFAERQPHMEDAISHLRAAVASLEKATADKGGHRVRAIELTNQAIAEVEKGIRFDDRH